MAKIIDARSLFGAMKDARTKARILANGHPDTYEPLFKELLHREVRLRELVMDCLFLP